MWQGTYSILLYGGKVPNNFAHRNVGNKISIGKYMICNRQTTYILVPLSEVKGPKKWEHSV
jgi:hypothetical protein